MTTAIAEPIKKSTAVPAIPADAASPTVNIAVSRIVPSPWNRKAEVTDDLVESVRQHGVLQNVILRPHKATEEDVALYSMKSDPFLVGESIFQLVAGERRWGAAKKAGKAYVLAAVRHLSDIQAMDLQIDENENRKNLRPMERAEAYDRLRMLYQEAHAKDKDYTEAKAIEAVAASRKCSARTVYDVISLKKLTQNAQHALRNGEMESSHGTAMSGRSPEEQEKLLLWLRQQTHHSQGDVPSVRRLKLEIRQLDIAAEDKKRQEKLFKDPQPGTATTMVPTVADAGKPKYEVRVNQRPTPAESAAMVGSSAPDFFRKDGKLGDEKLHGGNKPLSEAQIKKNKEKAERESLALKRQQDAFEREQRVKKSYRALFFAALAKKAQINSRLLTHVIPNMIFEVWENELPIEAFAQTSLGWPVPKDGHAYTYAEVKNHASKHTRKFTGGLLAAMVLTLYLNDAESLKLAKYMGVDPKKLRKQAETAVKEEERIARTPKAKKKGKAA